MSFEKMSTDEKKKIVFFKPDLVPAPHFVPGYTGHCPGLATSVGESYGRTTNAIIKEDSHLAGRLKSTEAAVAAPAVVEAKEEEKRKKDIQLLKSRKCYDQVIYSDYMPAGYTGHVPRSRETVGKTFGKGYVEAVARFERDRIAEQKGEVKTPDPPSSMQPPSST